MGRKSKSQTPAPKRERIKGSKINPTKSASTKSKVPIVFSERTNTSIKNKLAIHNANFPYRKVTFATAKKVVRRGMGAFSTSFRPFITGGRINSRTAWGLARLNAFLRKKSGKPVKAAYVQDDDLL